MTGYNLPPGCNISDIPGNRPEDEMWERETEKFCKNCIYNPRCNESIADCYRAQEFEKYYESRLNDLADGEARYEMERDKNLDKEE